MSDTTTLSDLRVVADYQFGAGAGAALFPPGEPHSIRRSSGGRPRQVLAGDVDASGGDAGERLVSYGTDGRFTLGIAGGRRLLASLDPPAYRVVVGAESEPFVRDGKNAFAKFVQSVDDAARPGDEVLVVDPDDDLLAVGRAELAAAELRTFDTGMGVKVRGGVGAAAD
ncbi:PUA domain-containing protein [Halopenitus sp. POP-27]|uniref:PUA domain-containing protein n=1 Tax=Halopenitus sp. POP-27 TaxID=2994425 RepID=UPI002468A203|nr:PUA domain-containing protein [Halopenitus sp. POP-27]